MLPKKNSTHIKKKKTSLNAQEKNEYNENESKNFKCDYIVLKCFCHICIVINSIEISNHEKSRLDFKFNYYNSKFEFTTNTFLSIPHSFNLETTWMKFIK